MHENLNPNREYYIDNKGQIRRKKKGLLALYNERVSFAFAYCKLKQCYLTSNNMSEKQCLMKGKPGDYCKHLYLLEGKELRGVIKRAKQKRWNGGKK